MLCTIVVRVRSEASILERSVRNEAESEHLHILGWRGDGCGVMV